LWLLITLLVSSMFFPFLLAILLSVLLYFCGFWLLYWYLHAFLLFDGMLDDSSWLNKESLISLLQTHDPAFRSWSFYQQCIN
jgi:hypothetical protein